jgi:hypothetical protein
MEDVVESLARATGTRVDVDPDARALSRCARVTLDAPRGSSAVALFRLVDQAARPAGLTVERGSGGMRLRRLEGVLPPARCASAELHDAGSPSPPATGEAEGDADAIIDEGILRLGEGDYLVTRAARRVLLEDEREEGRPPDARLVAHRPAGGPGGLKLYAIREQSGFDRLGLKNGDVLLSANGRELTAPESLHVAAEELRTADVIAIELVRRGRPLTYRYRMVDRLP